MFARFQKPADHQCTEVLVVVAALAVHYIQVLLSQLEWRSLKIPISRRVRQHIPKIDVYEMPLRIQQQVPVVPIPHLQDITQETVCRVRFDEILFSFKRVIGEHRVKHLSDGIGVVPFLKHVNGASVWQKLHNTRITSCNKYFIRSQPERQIRRVENAFELSHELGRQQLLSEVVTTLH